MIKVAIATTSIEKIQGIKIAFSRFFHVEEHQFDVFAKKIESGVSEQPFNKQIYIGALNRVENIKKETKNADYYVSCEAGIEGFMNTFFNVQVVCIYENKNKNYYFGKSTAWQVPSKDIEVIRKNNLDYYLRQKGIKKIQDIFGNSFSRTESISQAIELALASSKLL